MVIKPKSPDTARQAFAHACEEFLRPRHNIRNQEPSGATDDALASKVRIAAPNAQEVPVYTLTLDDIAEKRAPERAHAAGSRFLVVADKQVLAADVAEHPENKEQYMACFSRDPRLAETLRIMQEVDEYPEVKGEQVYELRLLRIPSILVEAFWLCPQAQGEHFIVTFLSADPSLDLNRIYKWNDFTSAAAKLAQRYAPFGELKEV